MKSFKLLRSHLICCVLACVFFSNAQAGDALAETLLKSGLALPSQSEILNKVNHHERGVLKGVITEGEYNFAYSAIKKPSNIIPRDQVLEMLESHGINEIVRGKAASSEDYRKKLADLNVDPKFSAYIPQILTAVEGRTESGALEKFSSVEGDLYLCVIKCPTGKVTIERFDLMEDGKFWELYAVKLLSAAREKMASQLHDEALTIALELKNRHLESKQLYMVIRDAYSAKGELENADKIQKYIDGNYSN